MKNRSMRTLLQKHEYNLKYVVYDNVVYSCITAIRTVGRFSKIANIKPFAGNIKLTHRDCGREMKSSGH